MSAPDERTLRKIHADAAALAYGKDPYSGETYGFRLTPEQLDDVRHQQAEDAAAWPGLPELQQRLFDEAAEMMLDSLTPVDQRTPEQIERMTWKAAHSEKHAREARESAPTVAELIAALSELPANAPVGRNEEMGWEWGFLAELRNDGSVEL